MKPFTSSAYINFLLALYPLIIVIKVSFYTSITIVLFHEKALLKLRTNFSKESYRKQCADETMTKRKRESSLLFSSNV